MSLTIKENNNATIISIVRDGLGVIQNISGWTFVFKVIDSTGSTVFQKSSAGSGEVTIIDAPTGKVNVFILPADTNNKTGTHKYEFKGTDSSGNQYTLNGPADFIVTSTII
jgi:hypothetical protein